jgi:hypothetical protein
MKRIKPVTTVLGVAAASALVALSMPAMTASAATTGTTGSGGPMTIARVVQLVNSVPDSAGKVTVALDNGAVIAISAANKDLVMTRAASDARTVSPNNRVNGNCGSSYIYVNERSSGRPVHMDTGFDVVRPAVEYAWHAHISGDSHTGYDYNYTASGGLANRVGWHGQHGSHKDYPHGTYAAGVYADGSSWALLNNGSVCYSGGPHDSRYL